MRSRHEQTSDAGASSAPRGPATATLFYSQAEAAADLGMSANGLGLARQRREVDGLYTTIGRRVLWSRPAIRLCALGITTPEQIGQLCRGLGIRDLPGLLRWLGDGDESEKP
jgi:hypothetical protein